VTYLTETIFGSLNRLGSLRDNGDVVDLRATYERVLAAEGDTQAAAIAAVRIPDTMIGFILGGERSIAAADAALAFKSPVIVPAANAVLQSPLVPGKLICMGRNYWEHAQESAMPVPDDFPRGFVKVQSTVTGPYADIPYPWATKQFDFEAELVIVIGKRTTGVSKEEAMDYVFGYTVMNDLSARDWQFAERSKGNHLLGKNLDETGPMGPAIILRRDLPDPSNIRVTARINGEIRQDGYTRQMIHDIPTMIAHWSRMTLEPGDIISTGTPEGSSPADGSSKWLKPGDIVETEVQGVGKLRNKITPPIRPVEGTYGG
jgi:acylpyruvate hydrolase